MDDLLSTLSQATGAPVPQSAAPVAGPGAFDPTKSYGTPSQMLDNLSNEESVMGTQELVGRGLDAVGAHTVGQWLANDAPYQQAHGMAAGIGDVAGGLLGAFGAKIAQFASPYLSNAVNAVRGRLGVAGSAGNASNAAASIVNGVLQQVGIDPSKVAPGAMSGAVLQIADALKSGRTATPNAAATISRIGEAASLPVPVELSAGQPSPYM